MSTLIAENISKSYGGVQAITAGEICLEPGRVHSLLGQNGAGKSTFVKILTGVETADSGEIKIAGEKVVLASPKAARKHGIAVVSQELSLFPDLDCLSNLYFGTEITKFGWVQRKQMRARAQAVLEEVGLAVSLETKVSELNLAQRQLLEIAKALLAEPRILVLDEPTSALDDAASQRLLAIISILRKRQVAVLFVSHILEEVVNISDDITILRDGKVVIKKVPAASLTIPEIVNQMLGETPKATAPVEISAVKSAKLAVTDLNLHQTRGFNLTANVGEIIGLAGLAGAGQDNILLGLAGHPNCTGNVQFPNQESRPLPKTRKAAVAAGVGLVSGDRRIALMPEFPIWENISQIQAGTLGRSGIWLTVKKLASRAEFRKSQVGIKCHSVQQPVSDLSGGNQQKVVLAKWLEISPHTLLLDDPTRGVDIGAKAEMHELVRATASDCVVLICSTDLDELVDLCDRVLIFQNGNLSQEINKDQLTRHRLLAAVNNTLV